MTLQYKLEDTDRVAEVLLKNAKHKTILFYGQMGSGKTTLIKAMVKALGVSHTTGSPTFSLVNEYETTSGRIYHFDLYRIDNLEEALDFGIEEYLGEDTWIFIEWPQIIEPLLPDDFSKIELSVNTQQDRIVTLL